MRAMDSNIPIGVTYVPEVPISVDTKEDLINIETNIRAVSYTHLTLPTNDQV